MLISEWLAGRRGIIDFVYGVHVTATTALNKRRRAHREIRTKVQQWERQGAYVADVQHLVSCFKLARNCMAATGEHGELRQSQ